MKMKINKQTKQNKLVNNFNKFPVKKKIFKKNKKLLTTFKTIWEKLKTNENI